jgi:hypothetical protein
MKLMKFFGRFFAIFLIAATATAFGKVVQAKVTVQILSPTPNEHVTSPFFVISGSATAKTSIAGVFYQLNTDDWTMANLVNGGKKWNAVVTLDTGTNTLRVYARDESGNFSSTNTVNFFYDLAVKSLTGLTVFATNDVDALVLSFSTNTFSESSDNPDENGVGTYTYSKANSSTGKITLLFKSPPSQAGAKAIWNLQFTNSNSGMLTDSNEDTFSFTISAGEMLVETNALNTVVLDDNDGGETVLIFPPPSTIFDNGHLFNVKNPMAIPLDAPFGGNVGDRVSVDIAHYGFSKNNWNFINTVKDSGTVFSVGENSSGTDTVTIFFDMSLFISSKDAFIPSPNAPNNLVTDLSFFTTNSVDDSVTPGGAFSYKVYSPIGALLATVNDDGSTNYFILTFTDTDSGNYFVEAANASGVTDESSGTFNLTASETGGSGNGGGGGDANSNLPPAAVTGKTLLTTNSVGYFEMVQFIDDVTFNETNSNNAFVNSTGFYAYATNQFQLNHATVVLDFTNGFMIGFTNFVQLTFTNSTTGSFHTDTVDASGNTNSSQNGGFILQ